MHDTNVIYYYILPQLAFPLSVRPRVEARLVGVLAAGTPEGRATSRYYDVPDESGAFVHVVAQRLPITRNPALWFGRDVIAGVVRDSESRYNTKPTPRNSTSAPDAARSA